MKLRRRPDIPQMADPWHRVRVGLAILGVVMAVGVVGYRLLGLGPFDAVYQTAITVTTVGFEEVGTDDQISRNYRIFTLGLVFFGVSGALYTLGVMVDALVEGSLNDGLRVRKAQRMIDKLSGHLIIAGAGRVGQAIGHYVSRHGAEVVVVDRVPQPGSKYPTVVGEATDDAILRRAGIDRAATLVAALDSDADNVYVTLSARALNADLFIVARTNNQSSEPKFFQAGADRVVNPHEIGGSRMGALAMHPSLAEFLDEVLHDENHGVRVDEIEVSDATRAASPSISDLVGDDNHPLVLAVRRADQTFIATPPPDLEIEVGSVLIVLGSDRDIAALRDRANR